MRTVPPLPPARRQNFRNNVYDVYDDMRTVVFLDGDANSEDEEEESIDIVSSYSSASTHDHESERPATENQCQFGGITFLVKSMARTHEQHDSNQKKQ